MDILIYIAIGLVSMVLAWVATIFIGTAVPFVQEPAGMVLTIMGGFVVIFWAMAWVFGMA